MRKFILPAFFFCFSTSLCAQKINEIITAKEVERIEKVLASDEMRGRRTFSPEIDKAADFIESEFKTIGLRTLDGNFKQSFSMVTPALVSISAILDGVPADPKKIIVITCQPELKVDTASHYQTVVIKAGGNLPREAAALSQIRKNLIVLVDTSYASSFSRLTPRRAIFKTDKSVIYILGTSLPVNYVIEAKHTMREQNLANVVGVLPGKDLKKDYVVFSGHYDHIGVGKPANGDSIYNGANDDAAGITAVILLAKYFKEIGNNERTLVFAAFTAEEIGGFGSQFFSRNMDAEKVVAMFNIEMIGTDSKWGKNSAYITGYEKTDMGAILQKNLQGSGFNFYPDPYPTENLFYRSDNATLARLGVPAHTISTAKMDGEPNYHKVTDHVETLDLDNMAMIIKSIALSAKTIISGKDTPTRVQPSDLR
jgi:hypothetical protein